MKTAILNTPIGFIEINGDEDGLVSVLFLDSEDCTVIPGVSIDFKIV